MSSAWMLCTLTSPIRAGRLIRVSVERPGIASVAIIICSRCIALPHPIMRALSQCRCFSINISTLLLIIDALNAWIYPSINNGVYRSGFAQSQQAHETAVDELFDALDRVEEILQTKRYLCGDILTEADIRLFATLIRFDAVYHTHFKCNRKLISQYPAMHQYMSSIYRMPGIAATIDMEHIRFHYFYSHRHINPTGIVPRGPDVLGAL